MTSMADTVATLREAVTQLQAALAPPASFGRVARFSPSEAVVLSAILRWEIASFEQIHQALFAGRSSDAPEDNIVKVYVCRIRAKLAVHGIAVQSWYSRGYRMAPEHKTRLRALMAGPVAMMDEGTI